MDKQVLFYVHVYRQKCSSCQKYSVARAEEEEMNWIVDQFVKKVSDFISGVKKPKQIGEKNAKEMKGPHQSSLCEACMLGKCSQKDNATKPSSKYSDYDMIRLARELDSFDF